MSSLTITRNYKSLGLAEEIRWGFLLLGGAVNRRKNRPKWAQSEKELMRHVLGKRAMRRYAIADYYFRQNWTAQRISAHMNMTVGAVKSILSQLRDTKSVSIPAY